MNFDRNRLSLLFTSLFITALSNVELAAWPRVEPEIRKSFADLVSKQELWDQSDWDKIPFLLREVNNAQRVELWQAIAKRPQWPITFWRQIPDFFELKVRNRGMNREAYMEDSAMPASIFLALNEHTEAWPDEMQTKLWETILKDPRYSYSATSTNRAQFLENHHHWPTAYDRQVLQIIKANRMPNVRGPILKAFAKRNAALPNEIWPEVVLAVNSPDPRVFEGVQLILQREDAKVPDNILDEIIRTSARGAELGGRMRDHSRGSAEACARHLKGSTP